MARSKSSQRDENHEVTRRAFVTWSLAAGASLGLSRSRIQEVLERAAGKRIAEEAGGTGAMRLVSLACGNGGLSHFQLCWPQVDVARARNPRFAWHRVGEEQLVEGTDHPLVIGPDTPWAGLHPERQVTAFVCGATETHVSNVQSTSVLNGSNVFAIATMLQARSSTALVPVVTIGDTSIGNAAGSDGDPPVATRVDSVEGLIALFDSAASQAGGLLADTRDAELFRAQYEAFYQLNRAANRYTQKGAYAVASSAADVLGRNRAAQLQITAEDLARYGIDQNTHKQVGRLGRTLIVVVKAFQADLTTSILLPAMTDDPHRHFSNGDVDVVPGQLKRVLDAFMSDLARTTDSATGTALADNVVIAINGDTPKHCLERDAWPDSTPCNANLMFLYSAGYLKSGWFGGIDRRGNVLGAGPDGKPTTYNGAMTARYATASLAYAIARGDEHKVAQYANGITIGGAFGRRKNE